MLTLIAVLLLSCRSGPTPNPVTYASPAQQSYHVGAYYHFWYPEAFHNGYLRKRLSPPQLPVPGEYNSWDIEAAEQHIAAASKHGIDFFCLDVWPGWPEFEDRIQAFLGAKNIGDIKFCIFFETRGLGYQPENDGTRITDSEIKRFKAQMERLSKKFFNHPQYFKINGRPVVVLYLTRTMYGKYAEAIETAREVFREGGHDVFLIGDEMYWGVMPTTATDTSAPPPVVLTPQPERIRQFDAITAYNFYWATERRRQSGYGAASTFLEDVQGLTSRYKEATEGEVPVIPSAIPGYNDRGLRWKEDHYVLPREWKVEAGAGSFFSEMLGRFAVPNIDLRAPILFITSWNEWNEDTGIEPFREAPPTAEDEKDGLYTQGYRYSGYGETYLKVLQSHVIAVTGSLTTSDGQAAGDRRVSVWVGEEAQASVYSDGDGYYNFSRLTLPPATYLVGDRRETAVPVQVKPKVTARQDFKVPEVAARGESRPRMPRLADNLEEYFQKFSASDFEVRSLGGFQYYIKPGSSTESEAGDPKVHSMIRRLVSAGDVVVDAGAGVGTYTLPLAALVGAGGKVYAFETRLDLLRRLTHNLKLNQVENVQAQWIGLSGSARSYSVGGEYQVELRRLDKFNFERVKLIRMALDESTAEALYGSYRLLRAQKPWLLLELPGGGDPGAPLEVRRAVQSSLFAVYALEYRVWRFHKNYYLCHPLEFDGSDMLVDVGDEDGIEFLVAGFSHGEKEKYLNYSWISDKDAIVRLPLPKKRAGVGYKLGLNAHAFGPIGPVEVELRVNDHLVGKVELDERWRGIEVPVDTRFLKAGDNLVSLRCLKSASPKELGTSSDERRLGAAVERVWLVPENFKL